MSAYDYQFIIADTKNCKTCDRVLTLLEKIGQEVNEAGVSIVRVNDKKVMAKLLIDYLFA